MPIVTVESVTINKKNKMAAGGGKSSSDELYKIRVIEEKGEKVKVHYVGYSKKYDEWKRREDLVVLDDGNDDESSHSEDENDDSRYAPLSMYIVLADRIKLSLTSNRRVTPAIRIEVPFDRVMFEGGLATCGTMKQGSGKRVRYTIKDYSDLNRFLGKGWWHWSGLNPVGDFCYVLLDSIEFYLLKKRPLQEYFPRQSQADADAADATVTTRRSRPLGYSLIFKFVRGDGTPSEFGKNSNIF